MVNLSNCNKVNLLLDKTIVGIEMTDCKTMVVRNRTTEGSINAVTI